MKLKKYHSLISLPVLIILFLTLFMAVPAYSVKPSFDCSKATTKIEIVICRSKKVLCNYDYEMKDGTEIIIKGFETRSSRPCPLALDPHLSIKTPNGRIIEKMPVCFREKPIRRTIDERCVDELNRSYVDKIISLAGYFVKLEDDSFLIYNRIEPTIIMRLNREMLMKFENTFENRVMWLDAEIIENITYNTGQLQGLHDQQQRRRHGFKNSRRIFRL